MNTCRCPSISHTASVGKRFTFFLKAFIYIHIHETANLLKCCLKTYCCQQIFYIRNLITKHSQEAKVVKYLIDCVLRKVLEEVKNGRMLPYPKHFSTKNHPNSQSLG